jgi:hypothetical protein
MFVGMEGVRKAFFASLALGAFAAVQAQSFLGTTDADYLGGHSRLFGSDIYLTWTSHGNLNGGSITAGGYGFMKWADMSSGDFAPNGLGHGQATGTGAHFYTLCGQFVYLNDPSTFNVWDISLGTNSPPLPGYRPYTLFRGASVISRDFDGAGGTKTAFEHAFGFNSNLRGAGIQLAVWAAIYGDGSSWDVGDYSAGTSTVTIGGFKAKDTHSSFATVVGYARAYYESARLANWGMGTQASTYWFDSQVRGNKYGQDQLTVDPSTIPQSVPEPFTVALMGGSAFAGYLRMRRRRK